MKKLLTLIILCSFISLKGEQDPLWMRSPSISPDGSQIVFTYKGNLYNVSSNGGKATQITFHEAHDHKAIWSNDGRTIAFASDRYGNFDIYTMNPNGGPAHRLTYHSNNETPYAFTKNDADILFGGIRMDDVNHRQYPHRSQSELYSIPVEGGRVNQIFTFAADKININSTGDLWLYQDKVGGEDNFRKHHLSSIAKNIWLYNSSSDAHNQITSFKGEDRDPVFSSDGNSFYYLSERNGSFNVYKSSIENDNNPIQLTNFEMHPVRFLSYGGNKLCFGFDGEIYTMTEGEEAIKLNIEIVSQEVKNQDKFVSINGGVEEMSVSPNGKEIAFISRGEVFVTSVDKSYTKRITDTPERERFINWGPEGKSIVYSCERAGKWQILKAEKTREEEPYFYASTLIKESALLADDNDNYLAEFSPDGKKMAYIKNRKTLIVRDLASGQEVTLLTPSELYHMRDGDKYFKWSPDSNWLLIEWDVLLNNSEVLLMKADGSKRVNLTNSGYYDEDPLWVNGGKQMLWFSNKNGLKSYATSGRSETDVYTMFFDQAAWDKFNLDEEEYKLLKELEEEEEEESDDENMKDKKTKKAKDKKEKSDKDKKKKEGEVKVKPLEFEWDYMQDRTARLTIHSSRLSDAVLSKDASKLYYLSRFEDKYNLWSTDLRTKETKMIMKLGSNGGSLEWDKEMKNLYLLSGGRISKIEPSKEKKEGVKIDGEMNYNANAERQAMFDHVWIRTNAIFYHPDFHGIDWNMMKSEYNKFVQHTDNSYEFCEILSEMLGELNVSHAGARPRTYNIDNADQTASLGVFINYGHKSNGILIDEIIKGGPLDKAKFDISKGMIIEKINGQLIQPDIDIARYLNRIEGKFTLLDILDPKTNKRQSITITPIPLSQENRLLYKRWVKMNEEEVESKSNGELGYVHIPGMSDGPYRSIYEDMMGKYFNKKGVIVDTRFNGGGDLVADLAMFFTGVPFITYATEEKVVGGEPTFRWTKPTLAIINEAQYSDGHCFACGYTDLKIGKTVGMPTPGTCSFAGWERLPDGSVWGVVPVSAKDINGNWMENNQTDPDIMVKNMPGKIDKGIDQQLERAIDEMMK